MYTIPDKSKENIAKICLIATKHSNEKTYYHGVGGEKGVEGRWHAKNLNFQDEAFIDRCLDHLDNVLPNVRVSRSTANRRIKIYLSKELITDTWIEIGSHSPVDHKLRALEHFCNSFIEEYLATKDETKPIDITKRSDWYLLD